MPTQPVVLGNLVPLAGSVPEGSPPTSYAAHAALSGSPKAIGMFMALTALRALIIAPGMAVAGIRGKQLLWGSLASSGLVSGIALVYCYALDRKLKAQQAQLPANPPIDTTGEAV
jgi:hypothetical protein